MSRPSTGAILLLFYCRCHNDDDIHHIDTRCFRTMIFLLNIRRGKALGFTWEMERAKEDFGRVKKLDPSLASLVDKDVAFFEKRLKEKEKEEMKNLAGKLI